MREAQRFLETLADILDHVVARGMEGDDLALLLEAARRDVETIHLADPDARYELGGGDVFWRGRPLAGTAEWAWRQRLLDAGVDRLSPPDDPGAFASWVDALRRRLVPPADRPPPGERAPSVAAELGIVEKPAKDADGPSTTPTEGEPENASFRWTPPPGALTLDEEAERVWWLHGEAANRGRVPRRESENLIARLAGLLRRGPATAAGRSLEPFDELTTAHVLNVAILAMCLGRHLAFDEHEVKALGLAGLYHDVGRVRVDEKLHGTDPTSESRRKAIAMHPREGAIVLMDSGGWFDVASVVTYEHHLTWRGTGGYPPLHFARQPHQYSRIVTICDVYDALRTERSHRPALTVDAALDYMGMLAGKTLDPEIVTAFAGLVKEPITCIVHPLTRDAAVLGQLNWLPDGGFDPDFEPRPVSL